jgi:ankyrin repeat protein
LRRHHELTKIFIVMHRPCLYRPYYSQQATSKPQQNNPHQNSTTMSRGMIGVVNLANTMAFLLACKEGTCEKARELIGLGVDLDATLKRNEDTVLQTALYIACARGQLEMVNLLLTHEADISAVGRYEGRGRTPLHLTCRYGHVEVTKLLIAHGADISAVDSSGQTLLHSASIGGNTEVVRLLLAHGADISAVNKDGFTALRLAKLFEEVEIVKILIAQGAVVASGKRKASEVEKDDDDADTDDDGDGDGDREDEDQDGARSCKRKSSKKDKPECGPGFVYIYTCKSCQLIQRLGGSVEHWGKEGLGVKIGKTVQVSVQKRIKQQMKKDPTTRYEDAIVLKSFYSQKCAYCTEQFIHEELRKQDRQIISLTGGAEWFVVENMEQVEDLFDKYCKTPHGTERVFGGCDKK